MTSPFVNALGSIASAVRSMAGVPVTYRRGELSVEIEQAVIGQTVFRLDDGAGGTVRYVSRDYLIEADALVLDEAEVEPQRGDLIEETVGGKIVTHEVMGPGNNEPDWRWSDPGRTTLRIHTKIVDEETAT